MPFNISVGSTQFAINSLQDLENDLSPLLQLGPQFAGSVNSQLQALASIPAANRTTKISYTGSSPQWKAGTAMPFTFSLGGSTAGSISVLLPGDTMFSYTDAFPVTVTPTGTSTNSNSTLPVAVGATDAFIALELDFSVNGSVSGSYSSGAFGLTANASGNSSVTVAFYKRCNLTDTFEAALTKAFQSFVLPLVETTLDHLSPGDYMRTMFNANLQLGVGATAGVDKVFGAGQIAQSLTGNQVQAVTVSASAKFEVQAGATLAIGYSYAGAFETVLWKEHTPSTLAHFHLYRSNTQTGTEGLNIGVKITTDATASIAVTTTQLIQDLVSRMPASIQPALTTLLQDGAGKLPLNTWVTEANQKITSWLAPLKSGQFTLDWSASQTEQGLLLTNYTIDTSKTYKPAWADMVAGRFVDAFKLANSGVTLDAGSGVEAVYKSTSSFTLNLFGKLNAAWTTTDIAGSSLVYLGSGIFHLIADTGVEQICNINGVQKQLDAYFAIDLDIPAAGGATVAPDLHIVFQAINNRPYGVDIANILGQLLQTSEAQTIQTALGTLAAVQNSTQTLHLVISQNSYKGLKASALNGAGVAADPTNDKHNYSLYTDAAYALFGPTEPTDMQINGQVLGYDFWGATQSASQGSSGTPPPSRKDWMWGFPGGALSYFKNGICKQTAIPPTSIYYVLGAANAFMNLCGDLQALAQTGPGVVVTIDNWNNVINMLKGLVLQDIGTFLEFLPATTLALANAVTGAPTLTAAPDPTQPAGLSLSVTLQY